MPGGAGRTGLLAYAAVAVLLTPAAPAAAHAAAPVAARAACTSQLPRARPIEELPYAQRRYPPQRLAPLADGAGIRVAVIDSGVDATHPQLRGRVDVGRDFLHGGPDGRQDCVGHGTGVASIIAAAPAAGTGVQFQGLAPRATIVPVRVSEQRETDDRVVGDNVAGARLAQAIEWAADPGRGNAQVVNLSIVMTENHPEVRRAVRAAIEADVVVVAAAGNYGGGQDTNPTPYPAAYAGVLGVGAIGANGLRQDYSQRGPYVDVVAPGGEVMIAVPRGGHARDNGTSFAAPFVAATAALIRQRFPGLSGAGAAERIIATADPAPGGPRSNAYGHGVLNPYRALTETIAAEPTRRPVAAPAHIRDAAAAAAERRRARSRSLALTVAGAGAGAAVLVGVLAAVLRHGRRRRWLPPVPD